MNTSVFDWLPNLVVGVVFTAFAAFKFYGLARGIVGGARKPFAQKLCGT